MLDTRGPCRQVEMTGVRISTQMLDESEEEGCSFRGLGAERRCLISKRQVRKINQSGYLTGGHELLHSDRCTMQQEEKAT